MILDIVRKAFGDKTVFRNFHLEIENRCHRYMIEGPSGCGKTTLMRIIAGLDADYEGSMSDPVSRPIVLFQENRLVECLSLEANLKAVSEDEEMISYVLKGLSIDGELKNPVSSLSGGMKRRAAIARALLAGYDSLLLDEPFTGLDECMIDRTAEFIMKEAGDRLIIAISHDRDDEKRFDASPIILGEGDVYL